MLSLSLALSGRFSPTFSTFSTATLIPAIRCLVHPCRASSSPAEAQGGHFQLDDIRGTRITSLLYDIIVCQSDPQNPQYPFPRPLEGTMAALPQAEYMSSVWRDGIFDHKVVFCTGGAGTICSAQVRALVHLGADACIIGRNVEKTETMARSIATARVGAKVVGIGAVDVRRIQDLEAAVARCVKELGAIDYVIAGAAGNFISPIEGLSPNAFKTVIDIDTIGSFNTLKATVPELIKSAARNPNTGTNPSTGGRIIFISATFHFTGMPLQAHASVAKAGIDALSANVALEYGPRGITSNIITPGPIAGTEGMARLGNKESEASGEAFKKNPLQRYGTVKEIADGTIYLFSDAGNFVNGEVLVIDGGDWRSPGAVGGARNYPSYLLDDTFTKDRAAKKAKL